MLPKQPRPKLAVTADRKGETVRVNLVTAPGAMVEAKESRRKALPVTPEKRVADARARAAFVLEKLPRRNAL